MNIRDAIKSGKRFKRPSWEIYYSEDVADVLELTFEDLKAEDYELAREYVNISELEFDMACAYLNTTLYRFPGDPVHITDYLDALKKELGL